VLGGQSANDLIDLTDSLIDISEMPLYDANPFLLLLSHIEALNGFNDLCGFLLKAPLEKRNADLRINSIRIQQVVFDSHGRLAKHIGDDSIQREIAHSESILVTILFTGTHGNEFAPVSGKFPKNPDILTRDVAAGYKAHSEQVSDPFGVLFIIFVALDSRNPFGVCDDNIDNSFKDIPDGNPILTGTFHADILAVVVKEPLLKGKQVSEGSTKVFLLTLGNQIIPCKDCGDEKLLVHIDAATDWNSFSHDATLLPDLEERQ
jgi:hypothetical protein